MTYLSVIAGAAALVAVSAVPAKVEACVKHVEGSPASNKPAAKIAATATFLSKSRTARA